ncbi:MAG TPA: DNA polymerase I, partial [Trueperaceae bacterium]|nr:DNA polymerase I [Trueperaceae bacterium]
MAEQESLFEIKKELPKAKKQNGHKVVIIDGHALIFRSYYAIRELKNSRGQSTNAVFGFMRSLLKILSEENEHDSTIVTFDAPAKTFRHEQFPDYKAGRASTPEDLPQQIDIIKDLVKYMGLYQIEVVGLEADDLIGTIAAKANELGYAVEIVTSDRDAYQLINENTCVRGLQKTDRYGPKEVLEKYGVTVEQWIDYRALTGDSSDNIPGARGIGPKSAQKLLERYGSLDYILENLDTVEPAGFAKKIEASLDDVKFSKMLSKIVTDADIEVEPKKWAVRDMDANKMLEILNELEFGSIIRELNLTETKASKYIEKTWAEIEKDGSVGFVLSHASPMNSDLLELSLINNSNLAKASTAQEKLEIPRKINAIDAKALNVWALKNGLNSQAADDPLLMANVIDSNNTSAEAICQRYAGSEWDKTSKSRAIATAELLNNLPLKMEEKQKELYEKVEKPLQRVLADMEFKGIIIDSAELKEQSDAIAKKLEAIENRVREIAENPLLNLNSRDQLAELLFDKLELSAGKKTSTGKRSTAVAVLEQIKDEHEVVALILEYREFAKLKSTYLDPLPKLVNPSTNRLHTTFRQHVVSTGRLSSINPNLQNIPIRTDIGRQIRKAFVAASGHKLIAADYSQIELRVLAHIAD